MNGVLCTRAQSVARSSARAVRLLQNARVPSFVRLCPSAVVAQLRYRPFSTTPPRHEVKFRRPSSVTIDDVTLSIHPTAHPELIPRTSGIWREILDDQECLHHLKWMLQKDKIGQDIMLIGPPDPLRRYLALRFCEISQRECEYISLSRDTVESDIKQRREMVQHSAKYIDQSAVRAAIEGRVLVIEGLERAERNILPIINNLLENREMALEDGRFLMNPTQYDKLLARSSKEELDAQKIVRTHPNFRVIALSLPVPPFQGNPLDPPLRSRFQARYINPARPSLVAHATRSSLSPEIVNGVANFAATINHLRNEPAYSSLPFFPSSGIIHLLKSLELFPYLPPQSVLSRIYPLSLFGHDKSISGVVRKAVDQFQSTVLHTTAEAAPYHITYIDTETSKITFARENSGQTTEINVPRGNAEEGETEELNFVNSEKLGRILVEMVQDHAVGRDIFLLGPKGSGKTVLVKKFAELLGYKIYPLLLYKDMAVRDLYQTRWTEKTGDTKWVVSNLVRAAQEGGIALLDNVHRLPRSVLPFLAGLVENRQATLYDGTRLVPQNVFEDLASEAGLTMEQFSEKSNIFPIHPGFRIVLVGETSDFADRNTPQQHQFLTPEIMGMFSFHEMPHMGYEEKIETVKLLSQADDEIVQTVVKFGDFLKSNSQMRLSLTLRQLIRTCKRASLTPHHLSHILRDAVLVQFLPAEIRQGVERWLNQEIPKTETPRGSALARFLGEKKEALREALSRNKRHHHLVPNILFHENPRHSEILRDMEADFYLGEHLLLIGNQGVGKNKLADRFLQDLGYPRQYIQLHRDSTVPSLIARPTLSNSQVAYEDTPLIIAIKEGHVLVVDEADKAQLEVVCVLKGIVDGELALPDGRVILKTPSTFDLTKRDPRAIYIHPNFRMIVLANRPGFPFMGNDFYRECGDLFSCHGITPPTVESEIQLLTQYAPTVESEFVKKLVATFGSLRHLVDKGMLSYPYSTREAVAIVRHMENFPNDSLAEAVLNVFSFDTHDANTIAHIARAFQDQGLSLGKNFFELAKGAAYPKKDLRLEISYHNERQASGPKHGKVDPNNKPHVGGNTWAGGTGGADTAGLGGKGGPYRLDAGHPVHQISDEEKAKVDSQTLAAARKMGQEALKKKLEEIGMGTRDYQIYQSYASAVQSEIVQLRLALNGLEHKSGRGWIRMKSEGELDETRLVEGLTGETTIFKRRGDLAPSFSNAQELPKKVQFVMDVSGSMYRFNGSDRRLERLLESAVLIMESFAGFENKIEYAMSGHSGDSHNIPFIMYRKAPTTMQERLIVLDKMAAHSQYCWSGDHTLEATAWAIDDVAKQNADERFVFVVSDANLARYGITPKHLHTVLTSNPSVKAFAIFIASRRGEAQEILESLPPGRAFVCLETSQLPTTFNRIFKSELIT